MVVPVAYLQTLEEVLVVVELVDQDHLEEVDPEVAMGRQVNINNCLKKIG